MVKTCSQIEKQRCLIIAFLTNAIDTVASEFYADYDTCSLINVKACINLIEYPNGNFNESFDKNVYTIYSEYREP